MLGFTLTNDKYIVERGDRTKQVYLKNKKGELICGPDSAYYNVFFYGDEVVYEMDNGNRKNPRTIYYIYHIIDNKKIGSITNCNEIRAMNNGNLILGIPSYDKNRYVIYSSKEGNVVSDNFDYIGEFSYSEDGTYSALARIDAEIGPEFGDSKMHFWGRINGNGKIITPLYNSVTNGLVFMSSEHSFYDEIEDSRRIMRERKNERKNVIYNLPIVEAYSLNQEMDSKKR